MDTLANDFGSYAKKRYRFCGKEKDEESGLYYYEARYYSPWTCRFISVDPLAGEYPFYTAYKYAGNQPINFIDLDGLEPIGNYQRWGTFPNNSLMGVGIRVRNTYTYNTNLNKFNQNQGKREVSRYSPKSPVNVNKQPVNPPITYQEPPISGGSSYTDPNFTTNSGKFLNIIGEAASLRLGIREDLAMYKDLMTKYTLITEQDKNSNVAMTPITSERVILIAKNQEARVKLDNLQVLCEKKIAEEIAKIPKPETLDPTKKYTLLEHSKNNLAWAGYNLSVAFVKEKIGPSPKEMVGNLIKTSGNHSQRKETYEIPTIRAAN